MNLPKKYNCQVLVAGSGIAGISAALSAAEAGCSVILACKGKLFSGSSFYPGTWGLGLIGPADPVDKADLARSIQEIGCGVAEPAMVEAFVSGIQPAIARVRNMGVKLRRADNSSQKEFIPCFDHKHRDWNGIEFDSAREIFSQKLREQKVQILSGYELLDLVQEGDRVCGAVLAGQEELCYVGCGAVVLATGGYGSLFRYHLCTEDVMGTGQHLALKAGCSLVNMEFMQMMPGYLTPAYKTIFNEKAFRFTRLHTPEGTCLSADSEAMALRSTHGPFTFRLDSKTVDFALFDAFTRDERGVTATYSEEMQKDPPEFIKVYFDWLLEAKGVSMADPIQIGIFAHAANGGIRIRPDASTGVEGLFAAGEVTGGMHGADRIGGLSTANGLVFGTRAGISAAAFAKTAGGSPETWTYEALAASGCAEALEKLQQTMFRNAMILRNERGLQQALEEVAALRQQISSDLQPSDNAADVARTRRFLARCTTAESILRAALLRKESRGSHYRTDHPQTDERMEKRILVSLDDAGIHAEFEQ